MSLLKALGSGVAGAVAVNAIHESARQVIPHPPRMDVIGMRAISRPMRQLGHQPPRGRTLRKAAFAGDLVSNALYYSLVGVGPHRDPRTPWRRGLVLGLLAGIGGALLPPVIGLGNQPGRRTPWTQLLTVLWYTLGGLAAAAAATAIEDD